MLNAQELKKSSDEIAIKTLEEKIKKAASSGSHFILLSPDQGLLSESVTKHFKDLGYEVTKFKLAWEKN